ncbi:hypothetical protein PEBR_04512 [Penicillium brasilianum]|uniref:Uncharacterized protein n=1 Tax=Penicillium brasilianum TaxID=104259 RepID=A0A0F7VGY3_PENBI|nr:hypothetical protein PEBR_04512 [Penicillium brasilianum]CEO59330.1 hypothetical protein PMG11_04009 [Penicillium brasilianum]
MDATAELLKRDANSPTNYSLYVLAIIVGCVVIVLIGYGIYMMYHGTEDGAFYDIGYEQRKYMREVRQRNINSLAVTARRPDMIVPVEELNY